MGSSMHKVRGVEENENGCLAEFTDVRQTWNGGLDRKSCFSSRIEMGSMST
jgi:hypothetical protein